MIDFWVVVMMEALLALLLVMAIVKDRLMRSFRRWKRLLGNIVGKSPGLSGSLETKTHRGERSMNIIYAMYGVATIVSALIVQVAECFFGSKSLFILINYGLLTYLFFCSGWFRNRIIMPLWNRISTD